MSSYIFAGVAYSAFSVTAPAIEGQPTSAEIGGAIDFRGWIIEQDANIAGETVEDGVILSPYRSQIAGLVGGDPITVEFKLDLTGGDGGLAWTTFPRGTTGVWYINRFGLATPGTPAIGDTFETWPVEVSARTSIPIGFDSGRARFTVTFAVPSPGPAEDFVLTA